MATWWGEKRNQLIKLNVKKKGAGFVPQNGRSEEGEW